MTLLVNDSNSDFRPLKTQPGSKITSVQESLLQECEKDIIWYRDNFFGKNHANFLGGETPVGPVALSIIKDGNSYKILYRTKQGCERLGIGTDHVRIQWYRKVLGLGPTLNNVIKAVSANIPIDMLKLCKNPNIPNELLAMEERQVIKSYKIGVAYLRGNQCTESEMFSNQLENASEDYKQFLNFLGETIELKGWKGYRAGLDVNEGQTGTYSVYTKWQGYEIMFHVGTHLPFKVGDAQQLERKRHIGNDIVTIIFQDKGTKPFDLSTISSHQNHIIAVIQPYNDNQYRFTICSRNGVPPFNPPIPEPAIMNRDSISRDFFLHKLVNGERASYKAPGFASKLSRTRAVLLMDIIGRYTPKK